MLGRTRTVSLDSLVAGVNPEVPGEVRFPGECLGAVVEGADVWPDVGIVAGTDVIVVVDELCEASQVIRR